MDDYEFGAEEAQGNPFEDEEYYWEDDESIFMPDIGSK